MLFDDWFTGFMSIYKADLKPRTKEEYYRLYHNHIRRGIGAEELQLVTPEQLQTILNEARHNAGGRTAAAVYTLLREVFRRAIRSRLLSWSPLAAVDPPRHRPAEGSPLTEADYQKALPAVLGDTGLALALLAGLRRGEIAGLRWQDVDLSARVLHVERQRQRIGGNIRTSTPKSSSGVRDIPISAALYSVLQADFSLHRAAWVLPYAPEYLSRHWARLQRGLHLSRHYRLHDLRHTYITRLILAGAVPRVVQYCAGHAQIGTTMRVYTHVSAEDAQKELSRLPSYMAG